MRRSQLPTLVILSTIGLAPTTSALDWQEENGLRFHEVTPAANGDRVAGFTRLTPDATGIEFENEVSETAVVYNRNLENGAGVALADVNGDGLVDIYVARTEGSNALFLNKGDLSFLHDQTNSAIACSGIHSTGVAFADVDGDGDPDLLVNALGGGTRLFLNDGSGGFSPSPNSGLIAEGGSTSMAIEDVDLDGDLDLYVTNYRVDNFRDSPPGSTPRIAMQNGVPIVSPADRFRGILSADGEGVIVVERGEPDVLYINDGDGHFEPQSWTGGRFLDESGRPLREQEDGWGLSAMFRDVNGDGAPDLYVCNDYFLSPDALWINDGKGGFRQAFREYFRLMSESSMGLDFADINRDGSDDLFVVDMLPQTRIGRIQQSANQLRGQIPQPMTDMHYLPESVRNTLFLFRPGGPFAEIARFSGLAATGWSWSVAFLDVDLDGWEDVLVTNGSNRHVTNSDSLGRIRKEQNDLSRDGRLRHSRMFPPLHQTNLAYRNNRDLTFTERSTDWGFDLSGVSHGMALGDLDNDGDLDVVINNLGQPLSILRNDAISGRIAIRLRGNGGKTRTVGARISVMTEGLPEQTQTVIAGGRYLSSDEGLRVFASGVGSVDVEIRWPDGSRTDHRGLRANRVYEISAATQQVVEPTSPPSPAATPSLFRNVSELLSHKHVDAPSNELLQHPLLPEQRNDIGPGIAWFDANRDGWDDLAVGGGQGGTLASFLSKAGRSFARTDGPATARDHTSVIGWSINDSRALLLTGVADHTTQRAAPSVRYFDVISNRVGNFLSGIGAPTGPIAMGDIDTDGDLDLLICGRVNSSQFPQPADARLFTFQSGRFIPNEDANNALGRIGVITAALMVDLDSSGTSEIVLACEWGAIRIFRGTKSGLTEITDNLGFTKHRGWWNGIATGDFDGDGRLDLVATNRGLNSGLSGPHAPLPHLIHGDPFETGHQVVIEADYDPDLGTHAPVRPRERITRALPHLAAVFPNNASFARATTADVISGHEASFATLSIDTLESSVFLNRGDQFERVALPPTAQFAPAFGVSVADFDGDGAQDLYLAQNFFGVRPDDSRDDAGLGLILLGNGDGTFRPLTPEESGVAVLGQQRGSAIADFNRDGRPDLATTQNRGATVLLENVSGTPGVRVSLLGPANNTDAIGAQIRPTFAGGSQGPLQAITSGTGYLSFDSPTRVIATQPSRPVFIEVLWPGGQRTEAILAPAVDEITITAPD